MKKLAVGAIMVLTLLSFSAVYAENNDILLPQPVVSFINLPEPISQGDEITIEVTFQEKGYVFTPLDTYDELGVYISFGGLSLKSYDLGNFTRINQYDNAVEFIYSGHYIWILDGTLTFKVASSPKDVYLKYRGKLLFPDVKVTNPITGNKETYIVRYPYDFPYSRHLAEDFGVEDYNCFHLPLFSKGLIDFVDDQLNVEEQYHLYSLNFEGKRHYLVVYYIPKDPDFYFAADPDTYTKSAIINPETNEIVPLTEKLKKIFYVPLFLPAGYSPYVFPDYSPQYTEWIARMESLKAVHIADTKFEEIAEGLENFIDWAEKEDAKFQLAMSFAKITSGPGLATSASTYQEVLSVINEVFGKIVETHTEDVKSKLNEIAAQLRTIQQVSSELYSDLCSLYFSLDAGVGENISPIDSSLWYDLFSELSKMYENWSQLSELVGVEAEVQQTFKDLKDNTEQNLTQLEQSSSIISDGKDLLIARYLQPDAPPPHKVSYHNLTPTTVYVNQTADISITVENESTTTIKNLWLGLDIHKPDGTKVENTKTDIKDEEPPAGTGKIGLLDFTNQGKDLASGEERTFTTTYRFDTSVTGHRYQPGDYEYRFRAWENGYPGQEGAETIGELQTVSFDIIPKSDEELLIFSVVGTVKEADDTPVTEDIEVVVTNETKSLSITAGVDTQKARYEAVFIGTENKPVAAKGDYMKVQVSDGEDILATKTYKLTSEDIKKARAIIDLKLKPSETEALDLSGDGIINIFDLVTVAKDFGKTGDDIKGDVNNDGEVNVFDLVLIASHFEEKAAPPLRNKSLLKRVYDTLKIVPSPNSNLKLALKELEKLLTPSETVLLQNYPNPGNPETWIPFKLADQANVSIWIYNISGEIVRTLELGRRAAGVYIGKDKSAYWNGRNFKGEKVSSGIYLYCLKADEFEATRRMLILK